MFYTLIMVMITQVETHQITTQNENVLLYVNDTLIKLILKCTYQVNINETGFILPPFIYLIILLPLLVLITSLQTKIRLYDPNFYNLY